MKFCKRFIVLTISLCLLFLCGCTNQSYTKDDNSHNNDNSDVTHHPDEHDNHHN